LRMCSYRDSFSAAEIEVPHGCCLSVSDVRTRRIEPSRTRTVNTGTEGLVPASQHPAAHENSMKLRDSGTALWMAESGACRTAELRL
jgi:hypothetical protein